MTQVTFKGGFPWPWNSSPETQSPIMPHNASNTNLQEPHLLEDPLKEITLDMMTIKEESLHRAYGREDILRDLVSKLPEGFVILQGYSGCGKTTLVHEIVWRIRHNQIPSLRNANVYQFKLRLAKGPTGALGNIYQWCVGGVKGSLTELIKQHIKANSTGEIQVLFFDEIHDLLTENMDVFDEFKEEIGNNNLKIIGATTNKDIVHELRNRSKTGEGMKRRVAVIEVPTMTEEQTQQAIPHLSPFKTPFPQPFNYQMDQETAAAIVALSSFHNEDVLPSSAMSLLRAVVTDLYDSTLRKGESSAVLTVQYVVDFIASTKRVPTLDLWQKIGRNGNELLSPESVQKELFPQIDQKKAADDSTQAFARQLTAFYHDQNRDPLLVLEGESELFLRDVLAHWMNGSSSAYICNVQKLTRETENSKKLSFAKEAFTKLFSGRRPVPLMVLTNIPVAWRKYLILEETLQPPNNPQALQHVVSTTVNDLLPMLLQHGILQLSPSRVSTEDKNGPSAVSAGHPVIANVAEQLIRQCSQPSTGASPPSEAKKTNLPVMVEWLFQRLLEEHIPLLMLNTADKQINVEKTSWGKIEVKALEFAEIVRWMEDRLQKRGSSLDNGWIAKMVFAIYLLKNSPVDSVANIAAKTVDELCRSQTPISDKDLRAAIQNAFSGMKRESEIDDALKRAQQQWE
ncbi:MAG TPA: ATP-binding protein, partial [Rhabdochlamydiaceae bacterium]